MSICSGGNPSDASLLIDAQSSEVITLQSLSVHFSSGRFPVNVGTVQFSSLVDTGLSGPRPDGQLEQIIETMLGTSARIGEVLAIRKCDVDVTVLPATVRICGTVVSPTGKPTYRQQQPKTVKSTRVVSVPSFAAEVLRERLVVVADEPPDHLIFFTRNHTPLTTNNVRRRLRTILDGAGISGVTPHSFRRTVATVLDRASGAELASEMLGHTSSKITKEHYIQPDEAVNPVTAEILESLAPRTGK